MRLWRQGPFRFPEKALAERTSTEHLAATARSFPFLKEKGLLASQSVATEMAETVDSLPSAVHMVHIGADDGVGDVTDMASTAAKDAGESVKSAEPNRTVKAKRLVASYEVMEKLGG